MSITRAKKSKDELFDAIKNILDEIRHDRKLINDINVMLGKFKVKIGIFNEILIDEEKLNDIDVDVLCLITIALFKVTKKEIIDPELFYNEPEMKKAKQYTGEVKLEIKYPLVFNNVVQVGNSGKDFTTAMSIQDINAWYKAGILNYNYETQRTPKTVVKKDGSIITKPHVVLKSVNEIEEYMLENKYKPDPIAINILYDGNDEFEYDEKNFKLTLFKCTQLDILDGFHRIVALNKALEKNPDLDLHLVVEIKNYTIVEAQEFFGQINTRNNVSTPRLRKLKQQTFADQIVIKLQNTKDLKGIIGDSQYVSNRKGELTTFSILSDAIDEIFNPQNKKDFLDVSDFLADFFGYLIASFKEEFVSEIESVKSQSWINHQNVFVGYIVLAKKLFDKGLSVNKIVPIIKNIDFSKETSPLNNILQKSQGKDNSKKVRKAIAEYFNTIEI